MSNYNSLLITKLPAPVQRYFLKVLKDNCALISQVTLKQKGRLRLDTSSINWFSFDAIYKATSKITFSWNAKVKIAPLINLVVLDSFQNGVGSGEVSLYSINLAKSNGGLEMNSGSLHRYLAELVWCPTSLLTGNGLSWTPINDERAMANLKYGDIEVNLEFIFNSNGELAKIYSPGRWGKFKNGFAKKPWEGHFSEYIDVDGYLVPSIGEVGWYDDGLWKPVWEAKISDISFSSENERTF